MRESNYPQQQAESERLRLLAWVLPLGCLVVGVVACLLTVTLVLGWRPNDDQVVCHAATEDSAITDCDYHDGAWHQDN